MLTTFRYSTFYLRFYPLSVRLCHQKKPHHAEQYEGWQSNMKEVAELTDYEKNVFKNFRKEFAKDNGFTVIPIAVKRAKGYLHVTLSDGDWLHVTPYGWY